MTTPNSFPSLDISQLKPNGSHFVVVSLVIPYRVDLPEDNYEVKIDVQERPLIVQVIIRKVEQSIETHPGGIGSSTKVIQTTSVQVFTPVRVDNPTAVVTRDQLWAAIYDEKLAYQNAALMALNRLLQIYRIFSGEHSIRPLTFPINASVALLFNQNAPGSNESLFTGVNQKFLMEGLPLPLETKLPESAIEEIRQSLIFGFDTPLHEELLLNAYDFVAMGNYRVAVIEAETAFEAGIMRHVLSVHPENARLNRM